MQTAATPIPGLIEISLDLHEDSRGWFAETWQRAKFAALGLPDLGPVQHNVSYNHSRGVTRGIHAEPWDKLVTVTTGRVFAAWVDLRPGPSHGAIHTAEIAPGTAVFVPRGVGNSYQTLEPTTTYSYLVNDHWRPDAGYVACSLDHPGITWPIPLSDAIISDKDQATPAFAGVHPMAPRRMLILGANGQLGRALRTEFPEADAVTRDELDITDAQALDAWPWQDYGVVLNAAAYTAVDRAEDDVAAAWAVNATAVAALAHITAQHRIQLVHYSTDYVFDGSREVHSEDEPVSPLGVYGASKAAGEAALVANPAHHLIRVSWLIGEGTNFVRTMAGLANKGVAPSVVDDQFGRLTFADDVARATRHLLEVAAPYGTYHLSGDGPVTSWADIAEAVYAAHGLSAQTVRRVSTHDYFGDKPHASRPRHSTFELSKLAATGFKAKRWDESLAAQLER